MARKMKDSGIEWIGEIPEEWDVIKLKYISKFQNGFSFDSKDLISDYLYPVIRIGDINGDKVESISSLGVKDNNGLKDYLVKKNDILIAMSGATVGKVGFVEKNMESYINQRVGIIRSEKPSFVFYNLLTKNFVNYIFSKSYGSAQPNISTRMIEDYPIAVPKTLSTEKIDNKIKKITININKIKETINKEIKTLEDYKNSIITEAVTKGLDKNVEMKDSGIEWIGEIPENWKLIALKHLSENYSGGTPSRNNWDYWKNGDIPWVSSGEVNKEYIYDTNEKITRLGLLNSSAKMFPKNTVLVALNGQGKTKGKTAILKINATTNQSLTGFICDEINLYYRYLYYKFISSYSFNRNYYSGGDNRDGIAANNLKTARLPIPSYLEQIKISDYLDKKNKLINDSISIKRKQLETLEEYKKSLIYEYVTGKKEVELG